MANDGSLTDKGTLSRPDTWHFFIYDVLYIAVLGAILYDILKGPEHIAGKTELNVHQWSIELSLGVMYVIDCLHTRAHFDSFDNKEPKLIDLLNTAIPLTFGYAFAQAHREEFAIAYKVLAGLALGALVLNLVSRERDWPLLWSLVLDAILLAGYLSFGCHPEWFNADHSSFVAWLPTVIYAAFAFFVNPRRQHPVGPAATAIAPAPAPAPGHS